jgi:hypothetical protein
VSLSGGTGSFDIGLCRSEAWCDTASQPGTVIAMAEESAAWISSAISLPFVLISVRPNHTMHFLVDQDLPAMDAVRASWDVSRSN